MHLPRLIVGAAILYTGCALPMDEDSWDDAVAACEQAPWTPEGEPDADCGEALLAQVGGEDLPAEYREAVAWSLWTLALVPLDEDGDLPAYLDGTDVARTWAEGGQAGFYEAVVRSIRSARPDPGGKGWFDPDTGTWHIGDPSGLLRESTLRELIHEHRHRVYSHVPCDESEQSACDPDWDGPAGWEVGFCSVLSAEAGPELNGYCDWLVPELQARVLHE